MFGLTVEKLLIIGVIAAFLLGPERLPRLAQQLGELVRRLKTMTASAQDRLREQVGPEIDDIDWKKLDPRQYDPRRIIFDALQDDPVQRPIVRAPSATASALTSRTPNPPAPLPPSLNPEISAASAAE